MDESGNPLVDSIARIDVPDDPRELAVRSLAVEGIAASLDEDRDIVFSLEGFQFVLRFYTDDPEFVQLVFPGFFRVESEDAMQRSWAFADRLNERVKGAKLFSTTGDESVSFSATVDFLVPDSRYVVPMLMRAAGALMDAVSGFYALQRFL